MDRSQDTQDIMGLVEAPLPPGRYELTLYSEELQYRSLSLELIPGQPKRLEIEMDPGFRTRVPAGAQLPDRVDLTLRNEEGEVAELSPSVSLLTGTGASCAFAPGDYEVEATAGELRGTARLTVPENPDGIVDVVMDLR